MSGNTSTHGILTHEQRLKNEYLIDEAAADARLSQVFRVEAQRFASEQKIILLDKAHAAAFFSYYKKHEKVRSLIRKAAKKFNYSDAEADRAIAFVREDFKLPNDLASAKMLLYGVREKINDAISSPSEADLERARIIKLDALEAMVASARPEVSEEPAIHSMKTTQMKAPHVPSEPPRIEGAGILPRAVPLMELARQLETPGPMPAPIVPAPEPAVQSAHPATEILPAASMATQPVEIPSRPSISHNLPALAAVPAIMLPEPTPQKPQPTVIVSLGTPKQQPMPSISKHTEKFIRKLAKKKGFAPNEADAAVALCEKYGWHPKPPRKALGMIHVTRARKERRESLETEALDLLNQARHGYDYIHDIARLDWHPPVTSSKREELISAVLLRYSTSGERIIAWDVLDDLNAEYAFSTNPAEYVSSFGRRKGYPRKVYMKAAERLTRKHGNGSGEKPVMRLAQIHPDTYCIGLLADTKDRLAHESQATTIHPKPRVLSPQEGWDNSILIEQVGAERMAPMSIWMLAKDAATATGTVLRDRESALAYVEKAVDYVTKGKAAARTIRRAAGQLGYTEEEADAAVQLSKNHFIVPADVNAAGDLLLQARMKLKGDIGEYIWLIAEEGGYAYSVAAEIEKKYLFVGSPLNRTEALSIMKEEAEFRANTAKFVEKACRAFMANAKVFGPEAGHGLSTRMAMATKALQHSILAGSSTPSGLLHLSREDQARALVSGNEYYGWISSMQEAPAKPAAISAPEPAKAPEAPAQVKAPEAPKPPQPDVKTAEAEKLLIDAVGARIRKMLEPHKKLEASRVMNADPNIPAALQNAWKTFRGEELSVDDALEMLVTRRKGLLDEFGKDREMVTELVQQHSKRVAALKAENDPEKADILRQTQEKLDRWEAVFYMPDRLKALMAKIGTSWEQPVDNITAAAAQEAQRRIRAEGAVVETPEQAKELLDECRSGTRLRMQMQKRVAQGLIPKDVAEEALGRIISEQPELGTVKGEMEFFAEICAKKGHPYPVKLMVYLMQKHEKLPDNVAKTASDLLDSTGSVFADEAAVRSFVDVVRAELVKDEPAPAKPRLSGEPAVPQASAGEARERAVAMQSPAFVMGATMSVSVAPTMALRAPQAAEASETTDDSGLLRTKRKFPDPVPAPMPAPAPKPAEMLTLAVAPSPEIPIPSREGTLRSSPPPAPILPAEPAREGEAPEPFGLPSVKTGTWEIPDLSALRLVPPPPVMPAATDISISPMAAPPMPVPPAQPPSPGKLEIVPVADAERASEPHQVVDLTGKKAEEKPGAPRDSAPEIKVVDSDLVGSTTLEPDLPTGSDVEDALERISARPPAPIDGTSPSSQTIVAPPPDMLVKEARTGEHTAVEEAAPAPAADAQPDAEDAAPARETIMPSSAQLEDLERLRRESKREAAISSKDDELHIMRLTRRLYNSRNPAARISAADELASIGTPSALFGLAGALEYGGGISQYAASLLLSPGGESIPALSSIIEEGSDNGKSAAVATLVSIGTQKAYDAVAPALLDHEYGIAGEAAYQLLLASGLKAAETQKHFLSLPDATALELLRGMLSGSHPTGSDAAAMVLRAEAALALAALLEARPNLASGVEAGSWMPAIEEWCRMKTVKAYDAIARALHSKDEGICAEATFQLLLARGRETAPAHLYFITLDEKLSLPLLKRALLGRHEKPDEAVATVRLQAAMLLDGFAKAGHSTSEVYPILSTALGETDPAVSTFVIDSLRAGGPRALPHMEPQLFTGSDVVVERAAELFLTMEGSEDEEYYAHSRLLCAALENKQVMDLLEARGSPELFYRVLNDSNADARARQSAALLVNREKAETALPLMLDAYLDAARFQDNEHKNLMETIVILLKAREREPEVEVPLLLSYYSLGPDLQAHAFAMLGDCDPAIALPLALRESKHKARAYDSVIQHLIEDSYGIAAFSHIADYAEKEYAEAIKGKDPAALHAATEEARFLISIFPNHISQEHSLRFLKATLPLMASMAEDQKTAVCSFAKRFMSDALPPILEYTGGEVAAGRALGDETAHVLAITVVYIGAKEGVEFFGHLLPEAHYLSGEALNRMKDLGVDLDPVRAEKLLLDYAGSKAAEDKLSLNEALVLLDIAKEVGRAVTAVSETKHSDCTSLLAHLLPMINEMGADEAEKVAEFASTDTFREGAASQINTYFMGRAKFTAKETAVVTKMLARINSDASLEVLTEMVDEERRADMRDLIESTLLENYDIEAEKGQKPVRETVIRAALGRKVPGKDIRDPEGRLTLLGKIAFNVLASRNDTSRDVILGCRDAHFCMDENDPDRHERLYCARDLLIRIGDAAMKEMSEVIFSPDFSIYPPVYRTNILRTVAYMAERSETPETKRLAKECLIQAVGDSNLDEVAVGEAMRVMRTDFVKDLAALLPPDPSDALKPLEDRVCKVLMVVGPDAHRQIGKMLDSDEPSERQGGALMVLKMLSREPRPADALKRTPEFQANLDAVPKLLLDPEKKVRDAAEKVLDQLWTFVSLGELEKTVKLRREKYAEMLPYADEVDQRRKAASLLARAGERAIDHFLAIIREPGFNAEVVEECMRISVSIGEGMLRKLVEVAAERGIREKYLVLHLAARCEGPIGDLLCSVWNHDPVWHNRLEPAGIAKGAEIPAWKSHLLQWLVVEGIVLRGDEVVASLAHTLIKGMKVFTPGELAGDFREAVDSKVHLYGWPINEKIRMSGLGLLESKKIATEEIRDEILRTPPAPGAEDSSLRENYRGFIRRSRTPPLPPVRKADSGVRKLVGPNGNGGTQ